MTNTKIYCVHKREKKKANAASVSFTNENDSLETSNNHVAGVDT